MVTVGSLVSIVILIIEYFIFKFYKGSKCEAWVNDKVEKIERMVKAVVEIYEKIVRCGRKKKVDSKQEVIKKLDMESK